MHEASAALLLAQATLARHAQMMRPLQFGKDYIDPGEVEDGGLTHDHCRKWKSLQELQVIIRLGSDPMARAYRSSLHRSTPARPDPSCCGWPGQE